MKRVFVSGGSGYIAMYCIKILLNKGYQVMTSVREQEKEKNRTLELFA